MKKGNGKHIEHADSIQRELLDGFEVQRALMKGTEVVSLGGLNLAGRCIPARGVSGDTYDYGTLPDGRIWIMLADVAGKGIPAALLMAAYHALFQRAISQTMHPAELGRTLHTQLAPVTTKIHRYVTAFICIYDPRSYKLDFLRAGHEYPIRLKNGALSSLSLGCHALGMLDEPLETKCGSIHLAKRECLLIYSDGVTDAENHAGQKFGRRRLCSLLKRQPEPTAESVRDAIFSDLETWNDDKFQEDDITVLALQRA
jgi:serine phosphatase RsbU (regulator of sigma subunit)